MTTANQAVKRIILSASVVLGALTGYVQGGTLASFTDVATSNSNGFATGKVMLLRDGSGQTVVPAAFSLTDFIPGETRTTSAIAVTNEFGTVDLCYTITVDVTANTQSLASKLNFSIIANSINVYGPAALSAVTGTPLTFTSSDAGCAAGSRRVTAGGADSQVVFQLELPANADTSYQTGSTTVTLVFNAQNV